MVNSLGNWLMIYFGTIFQIIFRASSWFLGIGVLIPLRGLTWGLFHTTLLWSQFTSLLSFLCLFCWFSISWSHCSVVPYWVVFCDIICHVFLSLVPEYVEFFLLYYVSDPITSHVYWSGYLFFCRSIDEAVWRCIFHWHWNWGFWVAYFHWEYPHGCHFLVVFK